MESKWLHSLRRKLFKELKRFFNLSQIENPFLISENSHAVGFIDNCKLFSKSLEIHTSKITLAKLWTNQLTLDFESITLSAKLFRICTVQ